MASLRGHLLNSSHEYVCLGHFSSDPIIWGETTPGMWWCIFYKCTTGTSKGDNPEDKTLFGPCVDFDNIEIGSGHSCSKYVYLLNDDKTMDVVHKLSSIEVNLPKEVKMALLLCCWLCCPKRSSNR